MMAEIGPAEYIDVYVNLREERTPDEEIDPNQRRWFLKSSPDYVGGITPEHLMGKMDAAGVEKALLNWLPGPRAAIKQPYLPVGGQMTLEEFRAGCEHLAEICRRYPGRLYPTVNIDPTARMDAVRMVEMAVREYGCRAVRMMGALTTLEPNHRLCYPIYAKCIEVGVPVVVNTGFPGPSTRNGRYQRPIHLDEVCVAFPELTVVATHVGHPWHLETVGLLQKHENYRLMTAGFVPKYVPAEIVHTLNTRAQHKVMWSSDYPIQEFQRCIEDAHKLPLREGVLRKYMRENALETFRFD